MKSIQKNKLALTAALMVCESLLLVLPSPHDVAHAEQPTVERAPETENSAKSAAADKMPAQIINFLGANSVAMPFCLIPAGEFMMGSKDGRLEEKPVHRVWITEPFYLGATEVTRDQWLAVMPRTVSRPFYRIADAFSGDNLPVDMATWNEAVAFCKELSQADPDYDYRLPTEAEWEYACRAGTKGDLYGELDVIAWHAGNRGGSIHGVAQKQPNDFGLYDMIGDVDEWCLDWYGSDYYEHSPLKDPRGPKTGKRRIWRGDFRASFRGRMTPDHGGRLNMGFRVVLEKERDRE